MLRIVCVGYRNARSCEKMLRSLVDHCLIPAQVVLWDNSAPMLKPLANRNMGIHTLRWLPSPRNIGFAKAVNEALKVPFDRPWTSLLLINPDAYLSTDLADAEFQKLISLNGICGLRVFNDDAKKARQMSARYFPNFLTSIASRKSILTRVWPNNPLSKRYLGSEIDSNAVTQVDWVSGCALFCSRDNWEKLGGFDDQFFLYVEDVDLGRRAAEAKIPVFFAPLVDVVHGIGGSSRFASNTSDLYHHLGMWRYFWKWSKPSTKILAPFVALGIALRFSLRVGLRFISATP